MKNNNQESTRYWSDKHEKSVCRAINALQTVNSGAGKFQKGDVVNLEASMLCECKTSMTEKKSVSIKKDWLYKNKEEAFSNRLTNSCLCFNFGPDTENYYIINEKLMQFLITQLSEELMKND